MMMMKKKWGILASACCCCCNRALMSNFLFCVATATTGDDRAPPKARPSSLFSILFFHFNITRVYLWSLQIPESVRRHKKNGWRTRWWWTVGVKLHLCRGETPLFVFFFSRWSIPNSWQVFFCSCCRFLLLTPTEDGHLLCCAAFWLEPVDTFRLYTCVRVELFHCWETDTSRHISTHLSSSSSCSCSSEFERVKGRVSPMEWISLDIARLRHLPTSEHRLSSPIRSIDLLLSSKPTRCL